MNSPWLNDGVTIEKSWVGLDIADTRPRSFRGIRNVCADSPLYMEGGSCGESLISSAAFLCKVEYINSVRGSGGVVLERECMMHETSLMHGRS